MIDEMAEEQGEEVSSLEDGESDDRWNHQGMLGC